MISLIITLAVVGLIVWALVTYLPMPPQFKTIIIVVACICVVVYLLRVFGVWGADLPIPVVR